jgi:hypothetical protein
MAPDGPTCADAVQTLEGGARAGENQIVARATTRYRSSMPQYRIEISEVTL